MVRAKKIPVCRKAFPGKYTVICLFLKFLLHTKSNHRYNSGCKDNDFSVTKHKFRQVSFKKNHKSTLF